MRPWLRGDLTGVDPRAELALLRDAVMAAAHAGEDLSRFWQALAAVDPVACAELAAGPRAVAHPGAVRAALVAAEALESVIAPSGLYARLVELAPQAADGILETVATRHPGADWAVRLYRRHEAVPGTVLLAAHRGGEGFGDACGACARAGLVEALASAAAQGSPLPAVALHRAGRRDEAVVAGAAALDADPRAPVLPYLAAVHGPEVEALASALLAHVQTDEARAGLARWVAVDPGPGDGYPG